MTTNNKLIDGKLETTVTNLAASIQHTEPVYLFLAAREKFNQDPIVRQIIMELSEYQRIIRQKQADNNITADDLQELRSLQVKAQENKTINSYTYAQQEAIGHMREINTEISNLLGIDFATLATNTSC